MFYRPGQDKHGLPYNPFKAMIAPRPIGWISTLDSEGRANLAPYSFFNAVSDVPPVLFFSSLHDKTGREQRKDTLRNIEDTGEFVHNLVSVRDMEAMNATSGSYAYGEDEFEIAGIEKAPSRLVAPPRVATAAASMECKLLQFVDIPGNYTAVLGEVIGIHIHEEYLTDEGIFDLSKVQPLARLGYQDYTSIEHMFSLRRPK